MIMPREINVNQLATAVMWWLSYSSAIGRDYVLSEGAIKFPVAEYLERSRTNEMELEFGHPMLSRKRIDLYFKNHLDEKNVFEFKYIKNDSTRKPDEKQRVFDDLMRLYLCLADNHKGHFLICGSQLQFISNFQRLLLKPNNTDGSLFIQPKIRSTAPITAKPDGFYKEWFSFDSDNPLKVIDLNTKNPDYNKIYKQFKTDYEDSYKEKTNDILTLPNSITTNLIFISEDLKQQTGFYQPSKIAIWEVTA